MCSNPVFIKIGKSMFHKSVKTSVKMILCSKRMNNHHDMYSIVSSSKSNTEWDKTLRFSHVFASYLCQRRDSTHCMKELEEDVEKNGLAKKKRKRQTGTEETPGEK